MCTKIIGKLDLAVFPDYKDAGWPIVNGFAIIDYGDWLANVYEDIAYNLGGDCKRNNF